MTLKRLTCIWTLDALWNGVQLLAVLEYLEFLIHFPRYQRSHIFCHSIYDIIFHPALLFSNKIKALENTRETSTAQSHLSKRTSTSVPLFALTLCLGRTDTESTANQLSILPPSCSSILVFIPKISKSGCYTIHQTFQHACTSSSSGTWKSCFTPGLKLAPNQSKIKLSYVCQQ